MKYFKRVITSLLALAFGMTLLPSVLAVESDDENVQLVYRYLESIDSGDWDEWVNFYAPSIRADYHDFVNNKDDLENNSGILTVRSLDVLSVQKVSNVYAPKVYYELTDYLSSEETYACYKVDIDTTVAEDNGYFNNGTSSHLIITVKDGSEWYIGTILKCPEELTTAVLASGVEPRKGWGFCDYISEPNTIDVKDENGKLHADVAFDDFLLNVLCNEIGNLVYDAEAFKANAIAIKMCGWWAVAAGYREAYGCDIKQGDVNYLSYFKTTDENTEAMQDILDDIDGWRMVSSSATGGKLFYGSYFAGSYGSTGKGTGQMRQNGSNYLATELGYDFKEIPHYFYDNSEYNNPNVGTVQITNN